MTWPPLEMFQVQSSPEKAIAISKKNHEYRCCISSREMKGSTSYHGAHLFERGEPKYFHLKSLPLNIFNMDSNFHTGYHNTFDYIRFFDLKRKPMTPIDGNESKIEWLITRAKRNNPEGVRNIILQIELLDKIRIMAELEISKGSMQKMSNIMESVCNEVYRLFMAERGSGLAI